MADQATIDAFLSDADPDRVVAPAQQVQVGGGATIQFAPLTAQALNRAAAAQSTRIQNRPFSERNTITDEAARLGARPGVPLDIESGVPMSVRFAAQLNRLPKDQLAEYQKVYGAENVQATPEGGFVLRNIGDPNTGNAKDVLVNPKGMDLGDAVDLIASGGAEIVAGALAARTGNAPGAWNAVKAIGGMALAGQGAGALQDVAVRKIEGRPVNPTEIAAERAKLSVVDAVGGTLVGGVLKIGTKLVSPLSARADDEIIASLGREHLAAKGKPFAIAETPAEASGHPLLYRMEARAEQMIGSSSVLADIQKQKDKAVQALQKSFFGLKPDATDAETLAATPNRGKIGDELLSTLESKAMPLESNVTSAKRALQKSGTEEIAAKAGVDFSTPVDITAVGSAQRASAGARYEKWNADMAANYDALFSHPLALEKNLPVKGMASKMQKVLKELPTEIVTEEVKTGVLSATGKPILRTIEGKEILKDFVPTGVLARLRKLASLEDQKFSLSELKQMRTDVDNAIAQGLAIPGTKDHYLNEMRRALTSSIEEGVKNLGDPNLKILWRTANDTYAKTRPQFDPPAIRKLLVKTEEGGIGNAASVESAIGKSATSLDTLNEYKAFFGASSPEFASLKNAIADDVVGGAFNKSTGFIDAKQFLSNLRQLRPQVAKEVFGNRAAELQRLGETVGVGQGTIALDELKQVIGKGSLSYDNLHTLILAEQKRALAYQNELLKAASKGPLDINRINPGELVNRFVKHGQPRDVAQIMSLIGPNTPLANSVKQLMATDLLENIAAGEIKGPIATRLSATRIKDILKPGEKMDRYRAVLGDDILTDLKAVGDALYKKEAGAKQFSGAGSLAVSSQIAQIFEHAEVSAIGRAINNYLLALMYVLPPVRAYLKNTLISTKSAARAVNVAIASEPFIHAVLDTFGREAGMTYMSALGNSVSAELRKEQGQSREDRFLGEPPQPAQPAVNIP